MTASASLSRIIAPVISGTNGVCESHYVCNNTAEYAMMVLIIIAMISIVVIFQFVNLVGPNNVVAQSTAIAQSGTAIPDEPLDSLKVPLKLNEFAQQPDEGGDERKPPSIRKPADDSV